MCCITSIIEAYKRDKRKIGQSEDTIYRVTQNAAMFMNDMRIGSVCHIRVEHVAVWARLKYDDGLQLSTIRAYLNSLRAMLRYVRSAGHCVIDAEVINRHHLCSLPSELDLDTSGLECACAE